MKLFKKTQVIDIDGKVKDVEIWQRWVAERPWYWEGPTWEGDWEFFIPQPGMQFELDFGVTE